MSYWVIRIARGCPDEGLFWCGYHGQQNKTHIWEHGNANAIRFSRKIDAERAGVGGPNNAYGRTDTRPDRGVEIVELIHE